MMQFFFPYSNDMSVLHCLYVQCEQSALTYENLYKYMFIAFSYSGDFNPNRNTISRYTISNITLKLILNNLFLTSQAPPPPNKSKINKTKIKIKIMIINCNTCNKHINV